MMNMFAAATPAPRRRRRFLKNLARRFGGRGFGLQSGFGEPTDECNPDEEDCPEPPTVIVVNSKKGQTPVQKKPQYIPQPVYQKQAPVYQKQAPVYIQQQPMVIPIQQKAQPIYTQLQGKGGLTAGGILGGEQGGEGGQFGGQLGGLLGGLGGGFGGRAI